MDPRNPALPKPTNLDFMKALLYVSTPTTDQKAIEYNTASEALAKALNVAGIKPTLTTYSILRDFCKVFEVVYGADPDAYKETTLAWAQRILLMAEARGVDDGDLEGFVSPETKE